MFRPRPRKPSTVEPRARKSKPEDFLTSGNAKNMCFEYGTEKEAKTKLSTVSSHKRKWNEKNPKKYDAYRVGNCIYIVRLTGKKG